MISRRTALGLIGGACSLAACSPSSSIIVGSKNFTESILLAEIYAQALRKAGMRVTTRLNLGSTQIAMAAIARGEIDLYPEYTGTALLTVLNLPASQDAAAIYRTVADAFKTKYGLIWLDPAPMNDTQAIATTQMIATRHDLHTLSQLSHLAPQLRLATIPEFLTRADGLPGLRKRYGGFAFKEIRTYDIGLKYDALLTGHADVATAFSTDGTVATQHLVLLDDDKHLWPPYRPAPVVREATMKAFPMIAPTLNAIESAITTERMQAMNARIESDHADPHDVAAAFLAEIAP